MVSGVSVVSLEGFGDCSSVVVGQGVSVGESDGNAVGVSKGVSKGVSEGVAASVSEGVSIYVAVGVVVTILAGVSSMGEDVTSGRSSTPLSFLSKERGNGTSKAAQSSNANAPDCLFRYCVSMNQYSSRRFGREWVASYFY